MATDTELVAVLNDPLTPEEINRITSDEPLRTKFLLAEHEVRKAVRDRLMGYPREYYLLSMSEMFDMGEDEARRTFDEIIQVISWRTPLAKALREYRQIGPLNHGKKGEAWDALMNQVASRLDGSLEERVDALNAFADAIMHDMEESHW